MRCSWFEVRLGRFRDGTLRTPHAHRVAAHLEACAFCSALFAEIDVVDALLVTTKAPPLPSDFTTAVMNDVHATPLREQRRFALWPMLALYLPLAWIAAVIALRIPALHAARAAASLAAFRNSFVNNVAGSIAATRAVAPASPLIIVTIVALLALDIAFIAGLLAYHRKKIQRKTASTSENL